MKVIYWSLKINIYNEIIKLTKSYHILIEMKDSFCIQKEEHSKFLNS